MFTNEHLIAHAGRHTYMLAETLILAGLRIDSHLKILLQIQTLVIQHQQKYIDKSATGSLEGRQTGREFR